MSCSKENSIKEIKNDFFEIKVSVPPEKGRANKRVIELITKYFDVPKSKIEIISGKNYNKKVINIDV